MFSVDFVSVCYVLYGNCLWSFFELGLDEVVDLMKLYFNGKFVLMELVKSGFWIKVVGLEIMGIFFVIGVGLFVEGCIVGIVIFLIWLLWFKCVFGLVIILVVFSRCGIEFQVEYVMNVELEFKVDYYCVKIVVLLVLL